MPGKLGAGGRIGDAHAVEVLGVVKKKTDLVKGAAAMYQYKGRRSPEPLSSADHHCH
jgi:hypothetical protein